MTTTVQQAKGLLHALRNGVGGAGHRACIQITRLLSERLREYEVTVTTATPDLAAWQPRYEQAFAQAYAAARWAGAAATLDDANPPSPPNSSFFDTSHELYEGQVAACHNAIAAVRAPTNGRKPMPRLATLVAEAHAALQEAYGNGAPTVTAEQTAADKALAVAVYEAAAFAGAVGIAWTPAA